MKKWIWSHFWEPSLHLQTADCRDVERGVFMMLFLSSDHFWRVDILRENSKTQMCTNWNLWRLKTQTSICFPVAVTSGDIISAPCSHQWNILWGQVCRYSAGVIVMDLQSMGHLFQWWLVFKTWMTRGRRNDRHVFFAVVVVVDDGFWWLFGTWICSMFGDWGLYHDCMFLFDPVMQSLTKVWSICNQSCR